MDKILYGLLSRVPIWLEKNSDSKVLTFEYICKNLFKKEGVENWEIIYFRNQLLSDNHITFIGNMPKITQSGIEFIRDGGYVEKERIIVEVKKTKTEYLKEMKRNKLYSFTSFIFSVIAIIISIIALFLKK